MQGIAAGALEIGHVLHWTTLQHSHIPYRRTMQGIAAGALIPHRYTMQGIAAGVLILYKHTRFKQGIAAGALIPYRYTMQDIAAGMLIPYKHTRFKSPMFIDHVTQWEHHQKPKLHLMMEIEDTLNGTHQCHRHIIMKDEDAENISKATQCKPLATPVSMFTYLGFS